MNNSFSKLVALAMTAVFAVADFSGALAADNRPAKPAFGAMTLASSQPSQPIGFYAKGCQAGAVQLPYDGPNWEVMRLARNRRWGQPQLVSFIEQLSRDAAAKDGWPGLLIGDMSQPRGGPMVNGHASHQIGLDVDIWLSPMPKQRLNAQQRESLAAVSMLKKDEFLTIDPRNWSDSQARLIMRAASYPQVQRIFVNPAIKKKLCESWSGDRTFMGKVRPLYGHDTHFHIRLYCPAGATNCKAQPEIQAGDGCGKDLAYWFTPAPWKKPPPPTKPLPKPRVMTVGDLPPACAAVLAAPAARGDDNMGVAIAPTSSTDSAIGTPITALAGYSMKPGSQAPVATAAAAPAMPQTASAPAGATVAATMTDQPLALPDRVPLPLPRPAR